MAGRRKYGRPIRIDLLKMMLVNALAGAVALTVVFLVFGVDSVLRMRAEAAGLRLSREHGSFLALMLPGAGIGYGCLWYWLILTGRSRGVSWGGACLYGALIAYGNVPFAGFLLGLLNGNPVLGALMALAFLLLLPSLLTAMTAFGLAMGYFNGRMAERWIAQQKSS